MNFIDLTSALSKQTCAAVRAAVLMVLAGSASVLATDSDAASTNPTCCSGSPATVADAAPQPAQETASGEHGQYQAGGKKARPHGADTSAGADAGKAATAKPTCTAHKRHYAGGKKARRHGVPAFGTHGCPSTCTREN
ncbi:hypothetical protein H5P28_06710 [Ruficoccus amylovorans]|uniref:Uncharacterized protein n=1 Tax=Ruficoccus amylovorans TaxID=1804625 RepID=A0A842HCH2_9BACT|nr:hypothetical protein [Ruficoccus amylovorans]MBC2593950.1 hypothetical protein [Ruficoccus amylovorans]